LQEISSENCIVLACLNSPELDSTFLVDLFKEFAPAFKFASRLKNLDEFASADEERSLKNLVFRKEN
jgi:23S rRNA (cytosine1962-C5)-methyltransferase